VIGFAAMPSSIEAIIRVGASSENAHPESDRGDKEQAPRQC